MTVFATLLKSAVTITGVMDSKKINALRMHTHVVSYKKTVMEITRHGNSSMETQVIAAIQRPQIIMPRATVVLDVAT
jgi:hypothetical protein